MACFFRSSRTAYDIGGLHSPMCCTVNSSKRSWAVAVGDWRIPMLKRVTCLFRDRPGQLARCVY
jgi:hypothetical protein